MRDMPGALALDRPRWRRPGLRPRYRLAQQLGQRHARRGGRVLPRGQLGSAHAGVSDGGATRSGAEGHWALVGLEGGGRSDQPATLAESATTRVSALRKPPSSRPQRATRYCQVDEKLVDRPPRYWARASREPAMLGIRNGRQPQLDNTLRGVRADGHERPDDVCRHRVLAHADGRSGSRDWGTRMTFASQRGARHRVRAACLIACKVLAKMS